MNNEIILNEVNIDDLYAESNFPLLDNPEEELETPTLLINLEEVNQLAKAEATEITERLSNYYFDDKYLQEHPYLKNKISQEINNIRRLLKMLSINEAAQDALIQNITMNAGKGKLNKVTRDIEDIFKEMQDNCEKTFEEKDLEEDGQGLKIVRGSKEFINSIIQKEMNKTKKEKKEENASKQLDLFSNET